MSGHFKRIYTVEAVIVGVIMALIVGVLCGGAAGIIFCSWVVALAVGCCMTLCSLDVLFTGR